MTVVSRLLDRAHRRLLMESWVLLLGVIVLATAMPLEAQVSGRLKRLGKDALKNAAKDKVDGKDSSATSASGATTPAKANASVAAVDFTITEERVSAVLVALGPAAERARSRMAANAERAPFEARREKFEACLKQNVDVEAIPSAANMTAAEKIGARNEALSKRVNKALADQDARAYTYAEDSARVGIQLGMATVYGATRTCGTPPYTPPALLEAAIAERTASTSGTSATDLQVADPALSLMTQTQFGMLRERIALFAMLKGGLVPDNKLGKEGVFTDAEVVVLEVHGAELIKLAPLFQGKALQWSGTADLRGW
ncbi:MAG: hypothetical protein IPF98_03495 [Gemmatimonadetes bacterium]|nr:hypothetical protein [Gemmatimonadota bacterium]MCC6774637.1 hypothetical protein [Gemmatimonadaceae bacterium]